MLTRRRSAAAAAALTLALGAGIASSASAALFQNLSPISIPSENGTETAAGSPFPSRITVSGITTAVTGTNVSLFGVDRVFADDVDVLLRGPGGQTVVLVSDSCAGTDFATTTLVFGDGAASMLPAMATAACATGYFKPTDNAPTEPSPAWPTGTPAGPYGTSLSALSASPNGNWDLFVRNGGGMHDAGSIVLGWQLTLDLPPGVPNPEPPRCGNRVATIVGTAGNDFLPGTPGDDVIVGLAGRDSIDASDGRDRICGNDGDDKLRGQGDKDILQGGDGKDRLSGGPPTGVSKKQGDTCIGGKGDDIYADCERIKPASDE